LNEEHEKNKIPEKPKIEPLKISWKQFKKTNSSSNANTKK